MRNRVYVLTVPRLLKWGLILPFILLPITLLEQREWWQHLTLLIGSYVVLVLGTAASWNLTDLAEKAGRGVTLVVRGCIGMALFSTILTLIWIATGWKIPHLLTDWRMLLLMVVFGVFYAPLPSRVGKGKEPRKNHSE